MAREKVLVGMSGGVDSAAAAALLKEEGFEVTGCILRLLPGDEAWEQNLADAQAVADTLGIRLLWADYSDLFRRQVVDYFTAAYQAGLTPNPCVRCNASVKFIALCREAEALGAPYIATGHYAQVDRAPGRARLLRGEDRRKDQSYFLYPLPQSVLRRLLLPLGRLTKGAVRSLAAERGLVNAGKRDSQDICFIPGGDYGAFLAERGLVSQPGDFRDTGGRVLGRHQGLERYTTGSAPGPGGQRRQAPVRGRKGFGRQRSDSGGRGGPLCPDGLGGGVPLGVPAPPERPPSRHRQDPLQPERGGGRAVSGGGGPGPGGVLRPPAGGDAGAVPGGLRGGRRGRRRRHMPGPVACPLSAPGNGPEDRGPPRASRPSVHRALANHSSW